MLHLRRFENSCLLLAAAWFLLRISTVCSILGGCPKSCLFVAGAPCRHSPATAATTGCSIFGAPKYLFLVNSRRYGQFRVLPETSPSPDLPRRLDPDTFLQSHTFQSMLGVKKSIHSSSDFSDYLRVWRCMPRRRKSRYEVA